GWIERFEAPVADVCSRVADEDIDRTKGVEHATGHGHNGGPVGDVAGDYDRAGNSWLAERRPRLVELRRIAPDQGHSQAALIQRQGNRPADSATCTCDERCLSRRRQRYLPWRARGGLLAFLGATPSGQGPVRFARPGRVRPRGTCDSSGDFN